MKKNTINTSNLNYLQMATAGIHWGTDAKYLNPLYAEFAHSKRFGKVIFDLRYNTNILKKNSFIFITIISNRGKFLLLDNIIEPRYDSLLKTLGLLNQYFLNSKIPGGILTNFRYIYFDICQKYIFGDLLMTEEGRDIYNKYFNFKNIRRLPDIVFISSSERVACGAKESSIIKIPSFYPNSGISLEHGLLFNLFGNNDSIYSLCYYLEYFTTMLLLGYIKEIHSFFGRFRQKNLERDVKFLNYWKKKNIRKLKRLNLKAYKKLVK